MLPGILFYFKYPFLSRELSLHTKVFSDLCVYCMRAHSDVVCKDVAISMCPIVQVCSWGMREEVGREEV